MPKKIIVSIGGFVRKLIPPRKPDFSRVRKVCFFKLGAIGDVLMTTPLVRAVCARFPKARIDYWVGKWSAPVLENNPHLDNVFVFDEKTVLNKNLVGLGKLAKKIRKKNYDVIFVLDFSYLSNLFALWCRIPFRIGFDRNGEGFPNNLNVPYGKRVHDIDSYLKMAGLVNAKTGMNGMTEIFLTPKEDEFARDFFKKNNLSPKKTIAIAPGGAKNPGMTLDIKRWPAKRFAIVAEKLAMKGWKILLVGGRDDKEAARIVKSVVPKAVDAVGKFSLKQSAALIKRCARLLCNDSGLMHVAAAVRTPVIAIFGPTDPKKLAPRGPKDKFLWKHHNKKPCYLDGVLYDCPDNHECVKRVTVQEVLRALS